MTDVAETHRAYRLTCFQWMQRVEFWPSESSTVNSVGKEGGQGVRDGGLGHLSERQRSSGLGGDRGSLYVIKS